MNQLKRTSVVFGALVALSLGACKKEKTEDKPTEPGKAPIAKKAEATTEAPEPPKPAVEEPVAKAPAEETGDYLKVSISHAEPKPEDPVVVMFKAIEVVKADFDPAKLEGATAELEIDMAQIDSGIPKRDGHLASPDYFDAAAHPKASVKISEVKAKEGDMYSAKAEVSVHGMSKTLDMEFKVVEKSDTSVTIEAEQKLSRLDFGIGKKEGDSVATEATAMIRMTFNKS